MQRKERQRILLGEKNPQGVHDGFAGNGCVAWPVAHNCFKYEVLSESGCSVAGFQF